MMQYQDIYRGYVIDYHIEREDVRVLLDGVVLHKCDGYDAACEWIDAEKRKALRNDA